jgi:hypothetical protein
MGRKQAPMSRVPKVRSWIQPTKVHTPKPKKERKHPKKDFENEWEREKGNHE